MNDSRHKAYRDFARQQTDMPIFSKDWYLDAVYGDGWEVVTVERGGQIVASMPYVLKRKAFFKYITQHPFTQTLGPYLHPDFRSANQEMRLMRALIEQLPEVDGFDQHFSYQIQNWLPFKWAGFQQTTSYTYVIPDITDTEKVWKGFDSNFRNRIRKAQGEVEVVTDRSLEDFYKLSEKNFKQKGIGLYYDFESLQRFDSRLYMECRNRIFFAQDKQGRLHSALYLTLGDESAYLHLAGEDPDLRNTGMGRLLIWEAIRYASETEKLKSFDFQGSVLPGVEKVRRESGAEQRPYFRVWKYNSGLFRMIKNLRS